MIDMVKAESSLVSRHNKLTIIIINLAICLAEKTTTMHGTSYNIFPGILS